MPTTDLFRDLYTLYFAASWKVRITFLLSALLNALGALFEGSTFCFLVVSIARLTQTVVAVPWPASSLYALPLYIPLSLAICAQLFKVVCCFTAHLILSRVLARVRLSVQGQILTRQLTATFSSIRRYKGGELVDILIAPHEQIERALVALNSLILSVFLSSVALGLMFYLSSTLALIVIPLLALSGYCIHKLSKRIALFAHKCLAKSEEMSASIVQSIEGLTTLHLFDQTKRVLKKMRHHLEENGSLASRAYVRIRLCEAVHLFSGMIVIGVIVLIGSSLLKGRGSEATPLLLGFVGIIYRLVGYVTPLIIGFGELKRTEGVTKRTLAFLRDEKIKPFVEEGVEISSFKETIEVKDLAFSYDKTERPVLDGLSFSIEKGKSVAIIGASGAGKSTLLNLLCGLLTPTEGAIRIDGIDLQKVKPHSWHRLLSVVSQEVHIFNGTIRENILLGREEASFEEVTAAAKGAGAHTFIAQLPDGYETWVGERGYRLSGGERQRLGLARALLHNFDVLILDEATSQLDSLSETWWKSTLAQFRGEKTLIVVAHRLSTVMHVDEILVLEEGEIVERGHHRTLLDADGFYKRFWEHQFNPVATKR